MTDMATCTSRLTAELTNSREICQAYGAAKIIGCRPAEQYISPYDRDFVTIRARNAAPGCHATAPRPGTAEREATT
jgi:hypothetical protein